MIVNLWMPSMSIPAEKTKTPRKNQKNNNLKNAKYQNVNYRGRPASTFSLPVRAARPLAPLSVTPLRGVSGLWMLTVAST